MIETISKERTLAVRAGDRRDWEALSRFHYVAGAPATVVGVLAIDAPGEREPAGVLVVSMPTLDAPWRERAWPGRYRSGAGVSKREAACRLNAEVRTISRVVVDPRWRGMGLARRLVGAYLRDPLTPATEAAAAMGACCPFFALAGMREFHLPPTRAAARLSGVLSGLGVTALDLACWGAGREAPALLRRELRLWAREHRATRARCGAPVGQLMSWAAAALLAPRIAYAAGGALAPA